MASSNNKRQFRIVGKQKGKLDLTKSNLHEVVGDTTKVNNNITTFINLTDTPSTIEPLRTLRGDSTGNYLEFWDAEAAFAKNTAFNKNFGVTAGTVVEGNDIRVINGQTAFGWGNHALAGYLTSITETDPVFLASPSAGILTTDILNWNTAFGWGNHVGLYLPTTTQLAQTKPVVNNEVLNSYNSVTGLFTSVQPTFASLAATPTTIAGYGITDTYTKVEVDGLYDLQKVLDNGNLAIVGSDIFQVNLTPTSGYLYSYFDDGVYNSTFSQDADSVIGTVIDSNDASVLNVLRGSISLRRVEGVSSSELFVVNPKAWGVDFNLETPTGTLAGTTYTIPLSANGVFADTDGNIDLGFDLADIANWNTAFSWGNHSGLYLDLLTYDPANIAEQVVGLNAIQSVANKTLINTSYINFDLAYVPTGLELPGTLFWNDTDETLDLVRNGTTLQLGQELYIRARNTTGVIIPNGTVVYNSGHTGIYPDISPAQGNSESTGNVIGITTEEFANNAFGAVTTFGYVRGLKTNYTGTGDWGTTWIEGDKLWLSKDIPGGITNIEPDAPHHSDEVGVVGVVHATQGTILVGLQRHKRLDQLSDVNGTPLDTNGQLTVWDNDLKLFDFTHNINDYFLTENTKSFKETVSTGIVSGGALSINVDNTKFDIAAGIGYIVDNTVYPAIVTEVSFGAFTAQTLTNLATSFATDIAIDVNGNIIQQDSFTDAERRSLIFLGGFDHSNQTNILSAFSIQVPINSPANSIQELARAVGDINIFGNVYGANGANLNIDKSGGLVFSYGRNNVNDKANPHKITESPQVVVSFGYVFNDGSGNGSFTIPGTSINPNNYDLGTGALGAVPVNDWSIQRILFFPNDDKTFVQYGTATYNKKEDALNAVPRADFPALSGIATAMVRGYLIVRQGETDLTSTNTVFLSADKFGNVAGLDGGGSLVAWGNIIGTLSDQLDLQDALDLKEPVFSKNTAFNKNFGTIAGTVTEGNDTRILNGQIAYSWGNHALVGYELISNKGAANGYAPLGADSKLPTAYLPSLAITSVIKAVETTLSAFAVASGSYIFEEGDVIVITTVGGDTEHYMYDGGTKTLTASYSLINNTQIDWSQIVSIPTTISGFGITDAYTKTESDNLFAEVATPNSFTAINTFEDIIKGDKGLHLLPAIVNTSPSRQTIGFDTSNRVYFTKIGTTANASLDYTGITASRVYTVPDASGTLVLSSSVYTKTESDNKYLLNTTDIFTGTLTVEGVAIAESLEFSSLNPFLLGNTSAGTLSIASDSSILVGSGIQLFGSTHATRANDIVLISDSTEVGTWTDAINTWNFAGDLYANFMGTWDGVGSLQYLRSDVADTKTAGTLNFFDNVRLKLGSSTSGYELYHDGTNGYISSNVGDLLIKDGGTGGTPTRFTFGRTTGNFEATGSGYFKDELTHGFTNTSTSGIIQRTISANPILEFQRWSGVSNSFRGNRFYKDASDDFYLQFATNNPTASQVWNTYFTWSNGGSFTATGKGTFGGSTISTGVLNLKVSTDNNILIRDSGGVSLIDSVNDVNGATRPLEFQGSEYKFRGSTRVVTLEGTVVSQGTGDSSFAGNVGIGNTNPSGKLSIFTQAVDSAQFDFTENSTSGYTTTFNMDDIGLDIGHGSALRSLNLKTGDLDRLTITGSGNVGIGTTEPITKIHVLGTSTGRVWNANASTVATFENNVAGRSFVSIIAGITGQSELWFGDTDTENRGRVRYNHSTDEISLWSASTQNLTIFSNSNTAIGGTTDNGYKLDVGGTGRFTDTLEVHKSGLIADLGTTAFEDQYIRIRRSAGGVYLGLDTSLNGGSGGLLLQSGAAKSIALSVNSDTFGAVPSLNITTSGNVGIGNTNNTYKLDVSGTGRFTGDVIVPDEAYGVGWNGSTEVPTKNAVYDQIRPYKTYVAILSQTSTNAPTAVVLENNLGVTISFARSAAGVYTATASGTAFTAVKTTVFIQSDVNSNDGTPSVVNTKVTSSTVITIRTSDIDNAGATYNDEGLEGSFMEIRVYP